MANVRPGSIAKNARRLSAFERLQKHLGDHKKNHLDGVTDEDLVKKFESHDKSQRKELERLKGLCNA